MTDQTEVAHNRGRWLTVMLLIAAALTVILGIVVAVAWFAKPEPITMEITEPVGELVICHLVIDGEPDVRHGTAPVIFTMEGGQIEFALIPVSADAGELRLKITSSHAQGSTIGDGIRGTIFSRFGGSGINLGALPPAHIASMRAAIESDPPEWLEPPRQ
jgi:hypothetical protein